MAQIRSKQISDFLSSIQWANVVASDNVKIANVWDIKQGFNAVDASVNSLESYISTEVTSLERVDSALSAEIVTEKERVDAILETAEADKDSFAEIVSLINSVDTENDNAFAAFVKRTDASVDSLEVALATEIATTDNEQKAQDDRLDSLERVDDSLASAIEEEARLRAAADSALGSRIDANDLDNANLTLSVNSLEVVDGELAGDIVSIDKRVNDVEGDLAAEITRAGSVEAALSAELAAEIATTNGEVNVINASIDSLEVAVEEGGTYLRQTATFVAPNLFTLLQPVAFGANDDLTVYVNGVFVDFICRNGQDIDFTGLLAYDVDKGDKVQVMGIRL